jgi:drug/metabolite transporter (DMT)-like permease
MQRSLQGYLLVLLAATFWASIGVFYKFLIDGHGVTPLAAAALRALAGGVILLVVLLARRADLRMPRSEWPALLGFGLLGVALFFTCYVNAIDLTGVAMAAVLMYTAPAWVAVISWRWMGERLGRRGVAALLLAMLGAALVAQVYDPARLRLNGVGVLLGLAAGLTYALYSVFAKRLARRNSPPVFQVWGLLIGALALIPLAGLGNVAQGWSSPGTLLLVAGMGIVATLLPSLAYSFGVQRIPVSVAAVVATFEPVVATLFGYLFFAERFDPLQLVGTACIVGALVLLRP